MKKKTKKRFRISNVFRLCHPVWLKDLVNKNGGDVDIENVEVEVVLSLSLSGSAVRTAEGPDDQG